MFDPILLENARNIFIRIVQNYKSSEDYCQRKYFPHMSFAALEQLAKDQNKIKVIQRFLLIYMIKKINQKLMENAKQNTQYISVCTATAELAGHGECEELSNLLIYELMKGNIPHIERREILTGNIAHNHAFIVITDKKSNKYVLDPFFKLICPLKEYLNNSELLEYFRSITADPEWNIDKADINVTTYSAETYKNYVSIIQDQIKYLISAIKLDDEILRLKNVLNIDQSSETFAACVGYLKDIFIESYKKELDEWRIVKEIDQCLSGHPLMNRNLSSATSFFEKSPHDELIESIEKRYSGNNRIDAFLGLLKQREYSRALRTACNDKQDGYDLVKILLQYAKQLTIDINEKASSNGFTAIHYAALVQDSPALYTLLQCYGASVNIENSANQTAEAIYNTRFVKSVSSTIR